MKAFTFLELMITAVMIALLSLAAFPSFRKLEVTQAARSTKGLMENCYLQAKAYAKAPLTPTAKKYAAVYDSINGCQVFARDANGVDIGAAVYRFPLDTDLVSLTIGSNLNDAIEVSTTPPYKSTLKSNSSQTSVQISIIPKNGSTTLISLINLQASVITSN